MKSIQAIALFCLAVLLGCGGYSGGGMTGMTSTPSVAGNWQFTGRSTVSSMTFTGTGALQQNGSTVTGTITLNGSPCAMTAPLSGTVMGTTFTFQLQEGSQPVNFNGTLNSTYGSASGNYTSPSGGCTNGDMGTWTATRM
jgi:hypothetical protein